MDNDRITFKGFLNFFNKFEFNICTKTKKEVTVQKIESVYESATHITRMLQKARKELSRAYKSHKAGKLSIDELFDYEWHVTELEQQLKNIEDLNQE